MAFQLMSADAASTAYLMIACRSGAVFSRQKTFVCHSGDFLTSCVLPAPSIFIKEAMFFGIGAYGVAIASTRMGPGWNSLLLGVGCALVLSGELIELPVIAITSVQFATTGTGRPTCCAGRKAAVKGEQCRTHHRIADRGGRSRRWREVGPKGVEHLWPEGHAGSDPRSPDIQ